MEGSLSSNPPVGNKEPPLIENQKENLRNDTFFVIRTAYSFYGCDVFGQIYVSVWNVSNQDTLRTDESFLTSEVS